MENKTLILCVGIPRSGKSTWARKQGHPIVNPDSIRLALHGEAFIKQAEPWVWTIAKTMVESLFRAGHDVVILDAANTTQKRRDEWINDEMWRIRYKVFLTGKEECIERAKKDNREDLIPVIEKMSEQIDEVKGEVWE